MRTRVLSLCFLPIALAMMTITATAQQDQTVTITSGGVERTFLLYLPSETPATNLPVVLCYHGLGSNALEVQYASEFNALADEYNFIAVYPQALQIGGDIQWNVYIDDQPGHAGIPDPPAAPDDVQFTRDIISYLTDNYTINSGRVYAAGFSNGGFMSYALSLLASDAIQAIAPVAANMWGDANYINQLVSSGTVQPRPVLHIHGTADEVVLYPDPDNVPTPYQEYPLFVASSVCNATTYSQVIPIMNGVDKLVFCSGPVEVSLIRVQGMGHEWTNETYQTSREIAKFFGLDKAASAHLPTLRSPRFTVAPNPASTSFRIELPEASTVQLVDALGQVSYSAEHPAGSVTLLCSDLTTGMYSVRVVTTREHRVMSERVVVVR